MLLARSDLDQDWRAKSDRELPRRLGVASTRQAAPPPVVSPSAPRARPRLAFLSLSIATQKLTMAQQRSVHDHVSTLYTAASRASADTLRNFSPTRSSPLTDSQPCLTASRVVLTHVTAYSCCMSSWTMCTSVQTSWLTGCSPSGPVAPTVTYSRRRLDARSARVHTLVQLRVRLGGRKVSLVPFSSSRASRFGHRHDLPTRGRGNFARAQPQVAEKLSTRRPAAPAVDKLHTPQRD